MLTSHSEIQRSLLQASPDFMTALNAYREKLPLADEKERAASSYTATIATHFKNLTLNDFEQALICYTAILLYTHETDEFLADMYRHFEEFMSEPGVEQAFAANPALLENRFVLHLDPIELVTPLQNPTAHFLLDANQAYVVNLYQTLVESLQRYQGFQYFTATILGYLANAFYLPPADAKSKPDAATETAYLEALRAREKAVIAFDHIYDPFCKAHGPIAELLDKAMVDFDKHYQSLAVRLSLMTGEEKQQLQQGKHKFYTSPHKEHKHTIEGLKLSAMLSRSQAQLSFRGDDINQMDAFRLMKEVVRLRGGIENCTVLEAIQFYRDKIATCAADEKLEVTAEYKSYLLKKTAQNNPYAYYFLADFVFVQEYEGAQKALPLLKKSLPECPMALSLLETCIQRVNGTNPHPNIHYLMECRVRDARFGRPRSLRTLASHYRHSKTYGRLLDFENDVYLNESARFFGETAIKLAERQLNVALSRGHLKPGEFSEIMRRYELTIERRYIAPNNTLFDLRLSNVLDDAVRTILHSAAQTPEKTADVMPAPQDELDVDQQRRAMRIAMLFENLRLAEKVQMLYVAIRCNPETSVRNKFITHFNALASCEGALELIPDPLNVDFLDRRIKEKLAAGRPVRTIVLRPFALPMRSG